MFILAVERLIAPLRAVCGCTGLCPSLCLYYIMLGSQLVALKELKEKYDIKDNTVVVEKSNTIKFVTKTIIGLLRFLAALIVFLLAITGLAAILYPDSRNILLHQALQVYEELLELL